MKIKFAIIIASILLALVILELLFRLTLFSDNDSFKKYRNPEYYAEYFSEDDYWKLYYIFDGHFKPPKNPHKILGWIGSFSRDDYFHNDSKSLNGRRPVLLYGDSYAQCSEGNVTCFETLLNYDNNLNKEYYLLNYGVGGYGLDQIFLLFKNTVNKYNKPFVILSFMVLDLDRSILSVRIGQKPYFIIDDNKLKLSDSIIYENPDAYYKNNPPQIKSYIYRKIIYSNLLPSNIKNYLKNDKYYIDKKIQINKKILDETVRILLQNNIDFIFLVFKTQWPGVSTLNTLDWRDKFLLNYFDNKKVPIIWSGNLINGDISKTGKDYSQYIDPGNGHPTTYLNKLIYKEITKYITTN